MYEYNRYRDPDEPRIMTIITEDGDVEEVAVLIDFEFKDTKKEFVIYTKEETDSRGNITVYASRVERGADMPKLYGVDTEDWPRVKDILWQLSRNDENRNEKRTSETILDEDGMEIL